MFPVVLANLWQEMNQFLVKFQLEHLQSLYSNKRTCGDMWNDTMTSVLFLSIQETESFCFIKHIINKETICNNLPEKKIYFYKRLTLLFKRIKACNTRSYSTRYSCLIMYLPLMGNIYFWISFSQDYN